MKSLKKKIMIPVSLLSIIGTLILSFFVYNKSKDIIINYVEQLTQSKAEKLASHVEDNLEKWKSKVNMLASMDAAKNMDYEGFKEYLYNHEELYDKQCELFFINDIKGEYVSLNGAKGNVADRKYFHEAIDSGNTIVSEPIISRITGNRIIVIASPIKDDNGNIIGLVGVDVNLSAITDMINDEKLGTSGYAYMISKDGLIISHPNKNFIYKHNILNDKNKDVVDVGKKMINGEVGIKYYEDNGIKKIDSYMPIKSTGWSIGMSANYDDETNSILILRNYMLLIGIGTMILILVLLNYLTDNLVKPINKLKRHMEIATKGDLSVECDIHNEDEIGILSQSFNKLIKENKKLLEETIEYDRLKTEFFSNISHELKTPLNIIFSTTQLLPLYTKNDNENFEVTKINKHINIMKQNCYRLLRLVNNLIDITKIDSGFTELNLKNKNIVEIIENITLSTVEYAKSKSRTIIFDTDVEEKIIAFDPEQMERVILNLISNAIKFTKPNDEIQVKICDGLDNIIISVQDTGIGIPKEKQKMIFERFRQVDYLLHRRHEGSGIGLSLVKSLIEMHDGKISVKSEYEKGTEFIIELPIRTIVEEDDVYIVNDFSEKSNIEKINIEFSDIYE